MAWFFKPSMAQKILSRELVEVFVQAGLGHMSLVLDDRLRPRTVRIDLERVPPSRWRDPPTATTHVHEVRTETAAFRQGLKLFARDLAANRSPGCNGNVCFSRANPIRESRCGQKLWHNNNVLWETWDAVQAFATNSAK